ncbi:type II toxin-antitoxin system VapC family toxin [uncultured Brevundimonas sp.]|uniref:type II toxin-antitoxin system VapC family toxin n=1 Tax=uncultured Brevundimonas sp. TaxID=213418 RepID=UPI0025EEDC69|nr:type II toxin-antitoxin system VapC family toxin [uncultured Brevundimonas sp.]
MTIAVFDASVAVKWLVTDDRLAPPALAARERYEASAPRLIQTEVANALWKYVRLGAVPLDAAVEGVAVLEDVMDLVPDERLLERAQRLSGGIDHPVYDCLYLVLARGGDAPLVTADRRLAEKSREIGVETLLIGKNT